MELRGRTNFHLMRAFFKDLLLCWPLWTFVDFLSVAQAVWEALVDAKRFVFFVFKLNELLDIVLQAAHVEMDKVAAFFILQDYRLVKPLDLFFVPVVDLKLQFWDAYIFVLMVNNVGEFAHIVGLTKANFN